MKNLITISIFSIIFLLGCTPKIKTTDNSTSNETNYEHHEMTWSNTTETPNVFCKSSISYPQFLQIPIFNKIIIQTLTEELNDFKTICGDPNLKESEISRQEIDYSIYKNTKSLISLNLYTLNELTVTEEIIQIEHYLNYNLQKDTILVLSDIFLKNINYHKVIGEYCLQYIKNNYPNTTIHPDFKQAVEQNNKVQLVEYFKDFYIRNTALFIDIYPIKTSEDELQGETIRIDFNELESTLNSLVL